MALCALSAILEKKDMVDRMRDIWSTVAGEVFIQSEERDVIAMSVS